MELTTVPYCFMILMMIQDRYSQIEQRRLKLQGRADVVVRWVCYFGGVAGALINNLHHMSHGLQQAAGSIAVQNSITTRRRVHMPCGSDERDKAAW